ncbi:unnamed protein product [Auanema sp. JU1783]|nr:unnamed protein product [Auanema sp. JU1783]
MTQLSFYPTSGQTATQSTIQPVGVTDPTNQIPNPFELTITAALRSAFEPENPSYSKRIPNCQKCGQHGRKSRLKGHKRVCPYKDCPCFKCHLVTDRQKLMAEQIKIRRRQRKDHLMNMTREQITSTLNAAAALSAAGNFTFNPLIFQENQLPCSLLTSPAASSDGSSYSPTNVINQPFRTSPELISSATPTSTATVAPVTTGASVPAVSAATVTASTITSPSPPSPQGILAPVAINPAFSFPLFNSEALIQLLASYKILDPAAPTLKTDHSQEKMDLSNPIIDVCSV